MLIWLTFLYILSKLRLKPALGVQWFLLAHESLGAENPRRPSVAADPLKESRLNCFPGLDPGHISLTVIFLSSVKYSSSPLSPVRPGQHPALTKLTYQRAQWPRCHVKYGHCSHQQNTGSRERPSSG